MAAIGSSLHHQRAVGLDLKDGSYCGSMRSRERCRERHANRRGNRVFISSDYGTVVAWWRSNQTVRRRRFVTKEMRNHHSSSVLIGDHLYGFSGGILTALKFDTGELRKDRSVGKGSLVYAWMDAYISTARTAS